MKIQNISNNGKDIYLFIREDDETLTIKEDHSFLPYYFEPTTDRQSDAVSIYGQPLKKIYCNNPGQVRKQRSDRAFEADIIYTKRYILDKIPIFEKSKTRIIYFDIEVNATELPQPKEEQCANDPISVITIYDNYTKKYKTFFLKDYESEWKMLDEFCKTIKKLQPDILTAWNSSFDYYYLYYRIQDFPKKISSIEQSHWRRGFEMPAGISIVDIMGLYAKYTLHKKDSYALMNVANDELDYEIETDFDFTDLEESKRKNKLDVKKMVELNEKLNLFEYFDEIRLLTRADWEDLPSEMRAYQWQSNNSKVIDMLALEEAKKLNIILPSKNHEGEKGNVEGAYRDTFGTGLYKDLAKVDLSGAYPQAIIDFCLSPENYLTNTESNSIKIDVLYRESKDFKVTYHLRQDSNTILPTLTLRLLKMKNELKDTLMNMNSDDSKYKQTQIAYDSRKALVNSAFGVFGMPYFRLYNSKVADTITFLVRDLLYYVEAKLNKNNYNIRYIDTDSIFYQGRQDITNKLNQWAIEWGIENYGNEDINIQFDYEGYFSSIFIQAMCLEGSSRVLTNKGYIPINKIYKNPNNYQIASVDENNKVVFSYAKKVFKVPLFNRKLYKIRNVSANQKHSQCILTHDHPILTQDGWKQVQDLKDDDRVQIDYFLPHHEIREVIIGTMLGDSTIYQNSLKVTHGSKQKEYAYYKAKLITENNYSDLSNVGKDGYKRIKLSTFANPYYKFLDWLFYKDRDLQNKHYYFKRKKRITSEILNDFSIISLAFLFMDDGYIRKTRQYNGNIATCCFTKEENILLSNKIKELGIDNQVIKTGKYYRINFNSKQIKILSEKIAPYIPKCMEYKIYPEYRDIPKKEICKIRESKKIMYVPFTKTLYNPTYKNIQEVYDIEIEPYHNFITQTCIAHNCRYRGRLERPEKGQKIETKGIQMKRRDSGKWVKSWQEKLYDKILDGQTKENLLKFIKESIEDMKKADIREIALPVKINKKSEDYKTTPKWLKPLEEAKKLVPEFDKSIGDRFYIIYCKSVEKIALGNKYYEHIKQEDIDWKTMIEKNIFNLLVPIFKGLNLERDLLDLAESYETILGSQHRNKLLEELDNFEELKKYYSAREVKKRIKEKNKEFWVKNTETNDEYLVTKDAYEASKETLEIIEPKKKVRKKKSSKSLKTKKIIKNESSQNKLSKKLDKVKNNMLYLDKESESIKKRTNDKTIDWD